MTAAIIKFDCPGCGMALDGPPEIEYEKVTCPTCQNEFYPVPRKIVSALPASPVFQPAPSPVAPASEKENLIQCPACQQEVSSAALNCVGCGHPLKQVESRDAFAVKLILAIILIVVAWSLWSQRF